MERAQGVRITWVELPARVQRAIKERLDCLLVRLFPVNSGSIGNIPSSCLHKSPSLWPCTRFCFQITPNSVDSGYEQTRFD